jgi:hypothetical protein
MNQNIVFKCHLCKHESRDAVEIGIHFEKKHSYNFISNENLV